VQHFLSCRIKSKYDLFEFIYKSNFVEIPATLVGDKFHTDKMLLCLQEGRDKMAELKENDLPRR